MGSLKRTHITYKCLATRNNQIFLHRKLVRGKHIVEVIVNLCFTSTVLWIVNGMMLKLSEILLRIFKCLMLRLSELVCFISKKSLGVK